MMVVAKDPHHDHPCEYGFDGDRWFHRAIPGMGSWQPLKRPRITERRVMVWADMVQRFQLGGGGVTMDGYELPANPDHWDDGDKLTHTARLLQQAERERDEARAQAQALRAAIGTDEEVEAYLHDLPWTPEDADRDRTLVAGNIRTFHAWIQDRAGIGGGS